MLTCSFPGKECPTAPATQPQRSENDRLQAETQELRARVDQPCDQKREEEEGKGKGKEVATGDDDGDEDIGVAAWKAYYLGSETGVSVGRCDFDNSDDELSETVASLLAKTEALFEELEQLRHEQEHAEQREKDLKTRVKELKALNQLAEEVRLDKNQEIEELNKAAEKIRLDKKTLDCQFLVVLNRVKEAEIAKVGAKMEVEKLKMVIERLKMEKEGFDNRMAMANHRIKLSDEKIKSLEASNSVLQQQDLDSRSRLEASQRTIDDQSLQIQGLQSALNQLHLRLQASGTSGDQSSGPPSQH